MTRKPKDDRVCDLGDKCTCSHDGDSDRSREYCPHFHLPNPHVISAYSTHRKAK